MQADCQHAEISHSQSALMSATRLFHQIMKLQIELSFTKKLHVLLCDVCAIAATKSVYLLFIKKVERL